MERIGVSLDGNEVKVVYATRKGSTIRIRDYLLLDPASIEDFLKKEKARKFHLAVSLPDSSHEILTLPPVGKRHLNTLIRNELKRLYPEQEGFIFRYEIIGDRSIEGRRYREVSVFALGEQAVRNIISPFIKHGKEIENLQPDYLSLFNLLPQLDEPSLAFYIKKTKRFIFFIHNNKILMVRFLNGISNEIDDLDIQNINMTVNYCRQHLKTEPVRLFIIGRPNISGELTTIPSVPIVSLFTPSVSFPGESVSAMEGTDQASTTMQTEAILPASAILKPRIGDFLPPAYKRFKAIKSYLKISMPLMVITLLVLPLIIILSLRDISDKLKRIKNLEAELTNLGSVYQNYREAEKMAKKIEIINRGVFHSMAMQTPEDFLVLLSRIKTPEVSINSIKVINPNQGLEKQGNSKLQHGEISVSFKIEGTVSGNGYSKILRNYNLFLDSLRSDKTITITSEMMNIENKSFIINGQSHIRNNGKASQK